MRFESATPVSSRGASVVSFETAADSNFRKVFDTNKARLQQHFLKHEIAGKPGVISRDNFTKCLQLLDGWVPHSVVGDSVNRWGDVAGNIQFSKFLDRLSFYVDGTTLVYDIGPPDTARSRTSAVPSLPPTTAASARTQVTPLIPRPPTAPRPQTAAMTSRDAPPASTFARRSLMRPATPQSFTLEHQEFRPSTARSYSSLRAEEVSRAPSVAYRVPTMPRPYTGSTEGTRPQTAMSVASSTRNDPRIQALASACAAEDTQQTGEILTSRLFALATAAGYDEGDLAVMMKRNGIQAQDGLVSYMDVVQCLVLQQNGPVDRRFLVYDHARRELQAEDFQHTNVLPPHVIQQILQKYGLAAPTSLLQRFLVAPNEVDYEDVLRALQEVDRDNLSVDDRPATADRRRSQRQERVAVEAPFATGEVKDTAAEAIQEARRKRLERVHIAFRVADVNKEGTVSREQFQNALERLKLYLNRDELDMIWRKLRTTHGKLNYEEFLQSCLQSSQDPSFIQPRSARNTGDILTWTTDPKQIERQKVLYSGKVGVLNDGYENWHHTGSFPFKIQPSRGKLPFNQPRDDKPPSRSQSSQISRNPLLTKLHLPLGSTKRAVDPLPSDRDSSFAYGRANGEAENITDVLAHVFMYDWMDGVQRRQQRSVRARRYHTRTSQMRTKMAQRTVQERDASQSQEPMWHMSRFKHVKPRTSTHFRDEMELLLPSKPAH